MSAIEWTNETWNPVVGCSVKSAGCTNCYAMAMAYRLERMGLAKYAGLTRKSRGRAVWTGQINEWPDELSKPHEWRKPRRIFVNSMGDLFHERVPLGAIARVWQVIRETPRHTYQVLTKEPERMAAIVADLGAPLPNVWLGVSVENADATHRLDVLRRVPAAVRFVSFEPLIGPVGKVDLTGIAWAIVGGESGPCRRPMQLEWARTIRDQCDSAGVSFFGKQWEKVTPLPPDLMVRQFPSEGGGAP